MVTVVVREEISSLTSNREGGETKREKESELTAVSCAGNKKTEGS